MKAASRAIRELLNPLTGSTVYSTPCLPFQRHFFFLPFARVPSLDAKGTDLSYVCGGRIYHAYLRLSIPIHWPSLLAGSTTTVPQSDKMKTGNAFEATRIGRDDWIAYGTPHPSFLMWLLRSLRGVGSSGACCKFTGSPRFDIGQ